MGGNRALLAAIVLIELHGPSGHLIEVNPAEISSVREPVDLHRGHWASGTHCVLVMSNGGFNAVSEDCQTVEKKLLEQIK